MSVLTEEGLGFGTLVDVSVNRRGIGVLAFCQWQLKC